MKVITKSIWILSLVSLFTDVASEMLYPILPLYLKSIGFSVLLIGVLEGVAEAVAGLSKGYFGKLSDTNAKRVPFVQWGYLFSALSKPMMGIFSNAAWVFSARTLDRFGKGLRTGARDALLSEEATPETKGAVFGFHRSMDTLGAVIGPFLALCFLYFYPERYVLLFYIAFFPGLAAVIVSRFLKEKEKSPSPQKEDFFGFVGYWKKSPIAYRRLTAGLLVFGLINSSDVFLLMFAKSKGLEDTEVIWMYILYNLTYALASFPVGILSDRFGLKRVLAVGLFLFSGVYFGMAFATSREMFYGLFILYGFYSATTEGISKALITNISDPSDAATAIGSFAGWNSIASLLASSLAGVVWFSLGPKTLFLTSAGVCLVVVVYLSVLKLERRDSVLK
ncbi:MFS transporter [Leptospira fluminis]|uniref:MFS transporter n=1 Tax=Leptospira fluminis TaxID=2484979 RepID=A0A4R9GRZ0_9LEPT|nr:MFS transporter [Leptospira fluminis]TGK20111.1 MFS transporter [Leptospira fluminis]